MANFYVYLLKPTDYILLAEIWEVYLKVQNLHQILK